MRMHEITEAFERQPITWAERSHDLWIAEKDFGGHKIKVEVSRLGKKNLWWFVFSSKKLGKPRQFEPDATRGKNMMILGFVVSCLAGFIDKAEPEAVTFEGNRSNGLAALYTAMSKFLGPQVEALGYRIVQPEPGEFRIQRAAYTAGQSIGLNEPSSPRQS